MDRRARAPECPNPAESLLVSAWVEMRDGRGEAMQSVLSKRSRPVSRPGFPACDDSASDNLPCGGGGAPPRRRGPVKSSPEGIRTRGIILGCDTIVDGGSFSLRSCGPGQKGGGDAGRAGPGFFINTDKGRFSAEGRELLPGGLHHLAGVYDGKKVRIYVDGGLAAENAADGKISNSNAEVTAGCFSGGGGRFRGRVIDCFIGARPLTGTEIKALAHNYRYEAARESSLRIELDTFRALDFCESIAGRVYTGDDPGVRVRVSTASRSDGEIMWQETFPAPGARKNYAFEIPVKNLPGGYYILEAGDSRGNTSAADLVVRGDVKERKKPETSCLQYVLSAVQAIMAGQSRPLLDSHGGVPFITISRRTSPTSRTIGCRTRAGYSSFLWPEEPFEYGAFRMDHEIWPVLDELSALSGDKRYSEAAGRTARAFIEHGFDPASGLIHFSEESSFDVRTARPHSKRLASDLPKFKPLSSGLCFDMHVRRLWKLSPGKTLRWLKAVYYGLVTDPRSMEYNRFCMYGFDDSLREPSLSKSCQHCAFETAGAAMIYYWSAGWALAGDGECLGWAARMAEKWESVQDKKSGLVPNFFGAVPEDEHKHQPPGKWCTVPNAATASLQWLRAAEILRERPGAGRLEKMLSGMGKKLSTGLARCSYDPGRRIFFRELRLDGSELKETGRYCFKTEKEKQEAVKINPELENVAVKYGTGVFEGARTIYALSEAALISGDISLAGRIGEFTAAAAREALEHSGPFTEEYAWTFPFSGYAVLSCVNLFRLTGDRDYLERARTIAGREIRALSGIRYPDWRRAPGRDVWLLALLRLHAGLDGGNV